MDCRLICQRPFEDIEIEGWGESPCFKCLEARERKVYEENFVNRNGFNDLHFRSSVRTEGSKGSCEGVHKADGRGKADTRKS